MKLACRGTIYEGKTVDLRGHTLDGSVIAAAVRGQHRYPAISPVASAAVYGYCGRIHPEMGLRTRTALAMAARSRGCETEYDGRITDLREQLRSETPMEPSLPDRRSQVPEEEIAELREAVATERGRLQAYQDLDAETADIESDLRETARTLSERETERTAAVESRRQRREAAREYRDRLERRRQIADELANRRREARAVLVAKLTPQFESALDSLPGQTPSDPFDAPPVTAALGILRLAQSEAPVVLEVDRFQNPTVAADSLDVPVVRC
jgi:hypothetical protein